MEDASHTDSECTPYRLTPPPPTHLVFGVGGGGYVVRVRRSATLRVLSVETIRGISRYNYCH